MKTANWDKKAANEGNMSLALVVFIGICAVASAALPYGIGLLLAVVGVAVLGLAGGLVVSAAHALAPAMGKTSTFGWTPSEAYLAGKKHAAKKDEKKDKKEEK